jgi:hypothetical protein
MSAAGAAAIGLNDAAPALNPFDAILVVALLLVSTM